METRILIIDDDPFICRQLEELYRAQGYVVDSATEAPAALAKLGQHDYSLVLVDLKIPGTDGLNLTREIRDRWQDIDVIMITGYASIKGAVEAIKLGARHYLVKPSNTDDIEHAFERIEGRVEIGLPARTTSIKTLEWERIHETLVETGFNVSETARRLGMHRRTLARKLEKQRVR